MTGSVSLERTIDRLVLSLALAGVLAAAAGMGFLSFQARRVESHFEEESLHSRTISACSRLEELLAQIELAVVVGRGDLAPGQLLYLGAQAVDEVVKVDRSLPPERLSHRVQRLEEAWNRLWILGAPAVGEPEHASWKEAISAVRVASEQLRRLHVIARELHEAELEAGSGRRQWRLLAVAGVLLFAMSLAVWQIERALERAITAREKVDQEQERLREELRQAQKMESLGRMASGVAHDFNNLLTVILGYADLLRHRPDPSSVDRIVEASRQAQGLTRQLLVFSRRAVVEPSVFAADEALCQAEQLLHRTLGEDLDLELRPGAPDACLRMDPVQFHQVVMNLALNARDAMPGGGTLTLATKLGRSEHSPVPDRVVLTVTDTGHGMDAETQARVVDPFYTTKPAGRGTGLGLATVYGIVTQANGRLEIESEPGRGTCIRVVLPRVEMPLAPGRAARVADTGSRGTGTILLVEDDPEVGALARLALELAGHVVHSAADPLVAFDLFEAHAAEIDLLVTDVRLPGMSGRDLAERLAAVRPGLPVLYVTGYAPEGVFSSGELDEIDVLPKPFTSGELIAAVAGLLAASGGR